jgi:alpha-1,2-mannosyltransferase
LDFLTPSRDHSVYWLTPRRLSAHGTILALCLWSVYVWTIATPGLRDRNGNLKGTDFLHFYTLGSIARTHHAADLYDMNTQAALAMRRVPEAAGIRYLPLYPPQVSILFMPFAHFSYGCGLLLWWVWSAAVYAVCCFSIWRACPSLRDYAGIVVLLALAFPPFFHLIAWGQTTALALACFTLMFFLLRDRREFLAGLVLGCLIFKPQLGLAAVIVFVSTGAWRVAVGAALSALGQLCLGVSYYGLEALRQWMQVLRSLPTLLTGLEPRPYQTHSLRTFWSMLVPWPEISLGLYFLSAAIVLGLSAACWKYSPSLPLPVRYSALLFASVLVSPHLTVYDLVILAPAFLLLADWLVAEPITPSTRRLGILIYLAYMLPLVGLFTRWTHVQLSVLVMALTVYGIWRIGCTGLMSAATGSGLSEQKC